MREMRLQRHMNRERFLQVPRRQKAPSPTALLRAREGLRAVRRAKEVRFDTRGAVIPSSAYRASRRRFREEQISPEPNGAIRHIPAKRARARASRGRKVETPDHTRVATDSPPPSQTRRRRVRGVPDRRAPSCGRQAAEAPWRPRAWRSEPPPP